MNKHAAPAGSIAAILRRVVATGFPELARLRISIAFEDLSDDDLLYYDIDAGRYRIGVGDCLRAAPRRVLEGGIAHELSHILHDCRLGPFQRKLALENYARSMAYRIRDERRTEMRVIERGFGEHLLTFVQYAKTLGYSFSREHGLLIGEVLMRLRENARRQTRAWGR